MGIAERMQRIFRRFLSKAACPPSTESAIELSADRLEKARPNFGTQQATETETQGYCWSLTHMGVWIPMGSTPTRQ